MSITHPSEGDSAAQTKPSWGPRLTVIGVSLALFLAACLAPALMISGSDRALPGGGLLRIGWMGIAAGRFGWFANPIYGVALLLITFRKWVPATVTAALALLVALDSLLLFVQEVPVDETGATTGHTSSLQIGFFLWIGSIAMALLGATWLAFRDRRP